MTAASDAPSASTEPLAAPERRRRRGAFEAPARRPDARAPTHPWEMGDEDPVDVEVLVDADQAVRGRSPTPVRRQRWGEDGSVVLTLRP